VRFAPEKGDPAFTPYAEFATVDLQAELSLSRHEFNAKFKGSPVKRAKRRGYLRNVVVAIGNTGGSESIPALKTALLNDSEPLVRGHAAWALGRIGGKEALEILSSAMETENDDWVLDEIYSAGEDSVTSAEN
jgi:epoxyqueuosine reductase